PTFSAHISGYTKSWLTASRSSPPGTATKSPTARTSCRPGWMPATCCPTAAAPASAARAAARSSKARSTMASRTRPICRRAIATKPDPSGVTALEIHVRQTPGGLFTEHVFSKLKVRDLLRFEGPLGSFYLREESDKPIILLASGTGFAPIRSIIEYALEKKIEEKRPMTLYWGCRVKPDLYQMALAESWQRPGFKFVPVLSDEQWEGRMGFVHRAVMQDFPDMSGMQVY